MPNKYPTSLKSTARPAPAIMACTGLILALGLTTGGAAYSQNIEVIPPPPKPAAASTQPDIDGQAAGQPGQSLEESLDVSPPVNVVHTSLLQILCDPDKYADQSVNFRCYSELANNTMRLYPTEEIAAANLTFDSIKSLPLQKDKITLLGIKDFAECNNTRVRVTGKLIHGPDKQPADVQIEITQIAYF